MITKTVFSQSKIVKVFLLIAFIAISSVERNFAQTNTFPTTGNVGVETTAPTHSITLGVSATGIASYNTSNQTTNYERARLFWDSNIFNMRLEAAGTGSSRNLVIGTANRTLLFGQTGVGVSGIFQFNGSSGSNISYISEVSTGTNASGTQSSFAVLSTMNQSGSAGYRGIWISPYFQASGSGARYLIDAGTNTAGGGAGTHSSLFVVNSAGLVGIGTTTPLAKLDIGGFNTSPILAAPSALVSANSNNITGLEIQNTNTGTGADARFAISDPTGNYLAFAMPSSGNTSAALFGKPRATSAFLFNGGGTSRDLAIGTLTSKTLTFGTNNAARITILATGEVGIGTATPKEALSVNGSIRSQHIKVETSGWPDYVFKTDYKLPCLDEVKKYVEQYKHLPEMPSEQDIALNGLDLGEVVKVQTKKIEELTLYLIEKEAKEKQQEARLKKLEEQLELLQKK